MNKDFINGYIKKTIIMIIALAFYGLGNAFCVLAGDAGCSAWNTLSIGLSSKFNVTYGIANLSVSIIIIALDIILHAKIGFGTILNTLLIPVFSDILIPVVGRLPAPANMFIGAGYALVGQMFIGLAMTVYMMQGLGAGPRDSLMVVIGKKLKKLSIGTVKTIIEFVVLFIGYLLGGAIGLGTAVAIASQSYIFEAFCRLFKFDSRAIQNEDIFDTIRNFKHNIKSTEE